YATWLGIAHPGATGFPSLPDWNDRDDMATLQSWAVTMISSLVGGASIAFIFGKTLHRIPLLGRMVMRPRGLRMETALAKTGGDIRAADGTDHAIKVGDAGRAHTTLRPAGIGVFDRHKVDVVTQGGYIDAGRPIRVVEVHGNRVVVKAARDEEISS
ncbi:MAG: hypothetical protein KDB53_08885, partial [Planctomycetes bacterium]|nr:hypothetical protein [Planctomycetota bacterium]